LPVEDVDHVGVAQLGYRVSLALQSFRRPRVIDEMGGECFHGELAAQDLVGDFVNRPHPAFADNAFDDIAAADHLANEAVRMHPSPSYSMPAATRVWVGLTTCLGSHTCSHSGGRSASVSSRR